MSMGNNCMKNMKIKRKNTSPSSYFKEKLYEQVPVTTYKRKKVSTENFIILQYGESDKLVKMNYNVFQLRAIARHYKQKISGNKGQLIFRIYNYLKFSFYACKIQKICRGYLRRKYNTLRGPGFLKRSKCTNATDFLSLENISTIPPSQFFSICDKDNFVYGFDMCSIYNLVEKHKKEVKNPYNRNVFSLLFINRLREIIKLSPIFGDKIILQLDDDTAGLSPEKRVEFSALAIFQQIDELGNNTNMEWFMKLNRLKLLKFIRELLDIWVYRANINPLAKMRICFPTGNPFMGNNVQSFTADMPIIRLRKKILNIIKNFITRGTTRENRSLGAIYVLTALTLVSKEAAETRPEFIPGCTLLRYYLSN